MFIKHRNDLSVNESEALG